MNFRKICYTAFVAFWSSLLTILALHGLAAEDDKSGDTEFYTLADVAQHSTEEDCWMAIDGKVYDLTDYLSRHPAPPTVMIPWCGKNATEGMRTKGYGRDHSKMAWGLLSSYFIGVFE